MPRLLQASGEAQYNPDYFGNVQSLGACRLVDVTTNLFRRSDQGIIREHLLTLEELVSSLPTFEAREAHDTFYAVLSLAKDAQTRIKAMSSSVRAAGAARRRSTADHPGSRSPEEEDVAAGKYSTTVLNNEPSQRPKVTAEPATVSSSSSSLSSGSPTERRVGHGVTVVTGNTVEEQRRGSNASTKSTSSTVDLSAKQENLLKVAIVKFKRSTKPANGRIYDVDYSQPFFDVCQQFVEFVLQKSGDLDILLRPWAPKVQPKPPDDLGLPSWIPTLDRTAHAPQRTRITTVSYKMRRRNADPLVGHPGPGKKLYDASKRKATIED